MLLDFCLEKKLCMSNTWFMTEKKVTSPKVTFIMGKNEAEIGFVLVKEEYRQFLRNVKAITW